ncbi:MAG: hypothetical protein V8S92_06925 [Oscillospiraceae bacterium]
MFEATLKNHTFPEAKGVTVTFPIPEDQYDKTIYDLDDIHIGGIAPRDCFVERVSAPDCPALVRMTGTMANIDELDWLESNWRNTTGMSCCNFVQRRNGLIYLLWTS